MKKILLITYHFAPYNNGGTFRALKFTKYLPETGWTPLVLACAQPMAGFRDNELLLDLPANIQLWRCPAPGIYKGVVNAANWLASWQRALLNQFFKNTTRELIPTPPATSNGKISSPGRFDRLLHNLFIPDSMVDWLPLAAIWARRIIRKYHIDAVMTTSPPHSTHLLGLFLPRRHCKWIVDLRDPWLENIVRNQLQAVSKYRQAVESRMEKWIAHHADRVIANTATNRRTLLQRYPALNPDNVIVIPNGFDTADLVQLPAVDEKPKKFVATFSGYLYSGMAETFFRALETLLRNDSTVAEKLRVQIIGQANAEYQQQIRASKFGLGRVVEWLGPMSHRQTLAQLQRSDLLLCFNFPAPEAAGVVPSKLYEYFLLAKPILAIGPEGEAATMLRAANAGQTFAPEQEAEIAEALARYLREWESGSVRAEINHDYVQRFDRRALTAQLAEMCEELCASKA